MTNPTELQLTAITTDPVYIGTGGFTIGRVDNTIVRDPTTRIPKIPGSSLAGTWRYYMTLQLVSQFKNEYKNKSQRIEIKKITEMVIESSKDWVNKFDGNRYASIRCAGQDDAPEEEPEKYEHVKGHCGRCIVCRSFGFSKNAKNESFQGSLFFSDLQIILFPVFTRLGTRWITSSSKLKDNDINIEETVTDNTILTSDGSEEHLNLGWLYLNVKKNAKHELTKEKLKLPDSINEKHIIVVPDNLIHEIINANLEVRTSVSIDPITGAAKDGALFTTEAIPRGTVFKGKINIFDRSALSGVPLTNELIQKALNDSKVYYESMGIGGMTTRGFGRMKIEDLK